MHGGSTYPYRTSVASTRTRRTRTRRRLLAAAVATVAVVLGAQPALASPTPAPPARGARPRLAPAHPTPKQPGNLIPTDAGFGPSRAERQAMSAAAAQAHKTGKPVVVDAITTETQQLLAQPRGGFTLSATPGPVRTKQHGSWVPISTALRHNSDGTLSPAATAYGTVRFSGGGTGPLAVTSSGGVSYAVTWPTRLPLPTVSGSTATYHNALGTGIDLVVSATDTGGFSDTLVITTAQAAKNPALAVLRLPTAVTGGTQSAGHAADGVVVSGRGSMVLESSTPQMWDSNTAAASPNAAPTVAPDRSDTAHPGLAAHVAVVPTRVSGGELALVPDSGMLRNPKTVFPVYVDPTTNWHVQDANAPNFDEVKSGSPCNGASYWDNTGSAGNGGYLGVGWNGWHEGCDGVEHAMYQWRIPTVVWGATISSATVNATEVYASQCSTTSTINLHETGGIGSGTDWNNRPGYTGKYATSMSFAPAENPTYCPSQGTVAHGFPVTSRIATAATQHWSQWTIALTDDGDEASHNRDGFKRFAKDPVLAINYDHTPSTPTAAVMAAKSASTNAACATAAPYPLMGKTIVSSTPVLNTVVTDPDGDKTQATFKYWVDGSSTTYTGLSADSLANKSMASFNLPTSFVSSLTNGQVVDWQAQVSDGLAAASSWSTVCHFAVEPVGPDAPIIQKNGTYPDSSDPATAAAVGQHAGTPAIWQVAGATTGATSVKFVYGLDQPPATSGPPASQVRPPTGTVAATPAGRWQANEGSGTTLNDSSGNSRPATTTNVGWATDPTRAGSVPTFNGSSSFAATSGPVLTTSQSFSVSAWAMITDNTAYRAVASQDATNISGFKLENDPGCKCWELAMSPADSTSSTQVFARGPAAALNAWTHLVASYNSTANTISLYVNDTLASTVSFAARTWSAAGVLSIGRTRWGGNNSDWFKGDIADVQVYQRALTTAEINGIYSATTVTATPLAPGPHTLYVYGIDSAGDVSADDAYPFIAASTPSTTCASLAACFNNTAISPDSNPSLARADGAGDSFSATELTNAGWTSGGHITINGGPFTLPAYGSGQPDNVLAANQTITYNYTVPTAGRSALVFLTTATNAQTASPGAIPGNTTAPYVPAGVPTAGVYCFDGTDPAAYCPAFGTVSYADGTRQTYDLTAPDWADGPFDLAAVESRYRNTPGGKANTSAQISLFSVPLAPGETVQSVTLPDVGSSTANGSQALHIFGMSARNTTGGTVTADGSRTVTPTGETWTSAWGAPPVNIGSGISDFTLRIRVTPSVSGNMVRIKADNSLPDGQGPLTIGHATIALGDHTKMTDLTFAGSQAVSVPEGGMTYSDPIPYAVTAGQPVLVSFSLPGQNVELTGNTFADGAFEYGTFDGTGDHTRDTTDDAFDQDPRFEYYGKSTDILTNLDVTTFGVPTQAVFGDGTVDAGVLWPTLRTDIASAMTSTTTTYGLVAEDIVSGGIMVDQFQYSQTIPGLSRIDRDILAQPGITSVILDEGLEDFLGEDMDYYISPDSLLRKTADDLTKNGYTQLLTYLQANGISVVATGLSPCDGYAGMYPSDPSSNDPCTSTIDSYRTATNAWLSNHPLGMGTWTTPALFYIDADATLGTLDASNNEMKLHPAADNGDHVNLSPGGYGALTNAYLGAQDTWQLGDGNNPDGSTNTTAADTASDASNPYLLNNPNTGRNPLTLSGGASWANDSTRGSVLSLDGSTGYAASSGQVLDTTGSFSVSTWVNMSSLPNGRNATIASQSGTNASAFYLQYNYTDNNAPNWSFRLTGSDTTNPTFTGVTATTASSGWTHLVGVYNAVNHTAQLYVNGTLAGTASNVTSWAATNAFTIGDALYNGATVNYLPGSVSNLQAWNYALSPDQITALYQQIS